MYLTKRRSLKSMLLPVAWAVKLYPISANRILSLIHMTDFLDFGCLDLVKQHESGFSITVAHIKSENIFFERLLKAQYSYNIFSLVVSKFTLKIPVEILAYLITKGPWNCIYFAMKAVSLEQIRLFSSINRSLWKHFIQSLNSKSIYYTCLKLTSFWRETVATVPDYGRDKTFVTNTSSVR